MGLTKPTKAQIPQSSRLSRVATYSKHVIRLVAFGFLAYYEIQAAAVLLVVAEIIAMAEQRV